MSYNTPETAESIVGTSISAILLEEARSLIDRQSEYRWELTTVTDTYSSREYALNLMNRNIVNDDYYSTFNNNRSELTLFLKMPVSSITSFTIDDIDQTEGTEYELKEDIGQVVITNFAFFGNTSLTGTDDISITYIYGYTSAHKFFPLVRGIEARIALLLQCNPLILPQINLQGDVTMFSGVLGSPLDNLLSCVPAPVKIRVL